MVETTALADYTAPDGIGFGNLGELEDYDPEAEYEREQARKKAALARAGSLADELRADYRAM